MKKYSEVRNEIKTGDMLLWRDAKTGPLRTMLERLAVRVSTTSPYTHVGVAWVELGRVWVMEITTHGCAPRLLSECGNFDWSPAPEPLTPEALRYAFSCFGVWRYSKWQAILGALRRLTIGADTLGQCAEYAIAIWRIAGIAPSETATPAACADGALMVWGSPIYFVENASG
jgi:hypothetical protein